MTHGSAPALLGISLLQVFLWSGCQDKGKVSAEQSKKHVDTLARLVDKDVGEINRGLPLGASKMSALYTQGADPKQDLPAVRTKLRRVRTDIPELLVAKSTFFALADLNGTAIRNDLDTDVMAGQNLFATFPALAEAARGTYVTTTGTFAGTPAGDKTWVAATAVKDAADARVGIYVTGWSLRYFSRHLQETLKKDVTEEASKRGDDGKIPVLYVAVFDREGIYSAPLTPPVTEQAMQGLNLVDKTQGGPASGILNITGRDFGYAAQRTPALGKDMGVIVLRSEV